MARGIRAVHRLVPGYAALASWSQVGFLCSPCTMHPVDPSDVLTFSHVYYDGRIIFWHARDFPPPPEVLEHYEDLAPNSIEFRILDRLEESEGTCLMDMPDWTDEETRKAKNMKPASLSNLTRLLLLSKVSRSGQRGPFSRAAIDI